MHVIGKVLLADYLVGASAFYASLPRLSGSQGPRERSNLRRGLHPEYVRVVGENRMEQSRAFFDTEFVITHSFVVTV